MSDSTVFKTEGAMTTRAIILYSTLLFSGHLFAQAKSDVIVMKNGDRLTGEIKALGGGVLSVDLPYVDGTLSVQWSQVAKLESDRLFLVHTEGGAVYTGKISATGASKDLPIEIKLVDEAAKEVPGKEAESKEVEVAQGKIIKLNQTALGFWKRFDGAINTGSLYSKGNESVQFNVGSQVRYTRERWQAGFNLSSSLASNSGAEVSTRNQIDLNFERLMRWNNWFYTGSASFLQSQVQEIDLQTTISGGVGRYLKNTNRQTITLFGGIGWQNARYGENVVSQESQNTAVGFVASQIKIFKFKKTNLDFTASLIPAITEPGRIHYNTNAVYYLKIIGDLSWNTSFYGSWDTRPPANLPKSDYGTSSGLSWTFGNR
jgi:Protein of unknown function, DUF481